ncbi:nucleotidyltransferase [bacterium]|nr:nucleotidyltransferase [bacterium]
MARTIAVINESLVAAKEADSRLAGLDSTSATAIWRLWLYIVAVGIWTLEKLFDSHKAEVAALIAAQRVHTMKWYVLKAKAFQYGYALLEDSDVYAVVDAAAQIVTEAAAEEISGVLRIKVAKTVSGVLAPLSSGERDALALYMSRVKDAGVHLNVTTQDGDDLHLALEIYYDALVLNASGERLDGTATTPVKDAVKAFLADLPFNGVFVLNRLVDAVQAVDGVTICRVTLAESQPAGGGGYSAFTVQAAPDAGYLVLDESYFDSNVGYIAY